ncbi:NO-associated protein 1, chloroplastic/mitochondrial isoform X2 [Durio zibethinus]|uniref:NO-associated protein 1, chloroplastic/mitochondrial isoform X2 n=1 Tax=Durio zibethinus TaxID=66656 RepID=A0A6P5YEZ4_DURZI|nr:NO-associated protein 1, chloroplastic/mitochondrial isoform X2 [Durio zibethinus]
MARGIPNYDGDDSSYDGAGGGGGGNGSQCITQRSPSASYSFPHFDSFFDSSLNRGTIGDVFFGTDDIKDTRELTYKGDVLESFLTETAMKSLRRQSKKGSISNFGSLMALKTLSSFLSPLSLPSHHNLPNFNYTSLNIYRKPTPVSCKSTQSQAQTQMPLSEPQLLSSEPEGTGAAAPTRGDRFLERQQVDEAAKLVINEIKKSKKKTKKVLKVNTAVASCYGCGAPLQTLEMDAPGYVDTDTYELKKKHHQLRTILCGRCRLLSHGHMITAVGGNGGYHGGKQFVSADELREKLSHLRHEKALIVKLVDIVDFNGSFLSRVRDLTGANPIILVVTKIDLLPKGTNFNCVGDWVVEATTRKKLNVLSVHLTSSKSLVGIAGVASEIQKEKKGSANVGKSAFISSLLKMMAQRDPAAAAAQKYKPIQSAVPGTTLGPIQINAFLGGGKLYDTPGVHLHHRQAAVVHSEDLPVLAPQSRLIGQSFPSASKNGMAGKFNANGLNGFSIFWGGLVRIDILKVLPETCLTFYGPKKLQIHAVPTDEADEFYKKELGVLLTPPTGKDRADEWRGLETVQQLQLNFEDAERPASDVAISGLGWITIEARRKSLGISDNLVETIKELHLAVHVPRPVEIFVRPSIPVGKAGAEWYQYRELTEKEEEIRPKWYF